MSALIANSRYLILRERKEPEMRLWNENREFLKKRHLTINKAIAMLIEQERDANEGGSTLFPEKEGDGDGK